MNKKIPLNRENQAYWDNRIDAVETYIKKNIADDEAYNKVLQSYYQKAIKAIDDDINAELMRLGKGNLPLAQQQVKRMDIQKMAARAKEIVKNKDWSEEANIRMKIYNATMQINRLELLKSQIGYDMLNAGMQIDADVKKKLTDAYQDELKRQAGILADTVPAKSLINLPHTMKVVMTGIKGVDFSHRLWINQDVLKARLDTILVQSTLTGESPQKLAQRLYNLVSNEVTKHSYVTERIVRTETARVQTQATIDSLNQYGYKYCKWHAEPGACKYCADIAGFDSLGINQLGVYKVDDVPPLPEHPNCRCAISAYWIDNDSNIKGVSKLPKQPENDNNSLDDLLKLPNDKISEQQIRQIGSVLYDNLCKQGVQNAEKLQELKNNFDNLKQERKAKHISNSEYMVAWNDNVKNIQLLRDKQAKIVAAEISKYRQVGLQQKLVFQKGSSVPLKKLVNDSYEHYPTKWSELGELHNSLKLKHSYRGDYIESMQRLDAPVDSLESSTTVYHELAHRAECSVPDIVRLEHEFYERRTNGEKSQYLSELLGKASYGNEQTKPDHFIDPYMGKTYVNNNGEYTNFELLSMGVEGVYQATCNIYQDKDYATFILGLLAKI